MSYEALSRRAFLTGSAAAGSSIFLGSVLTALDACAEPAAAEMVGDPASQMTVTPGFLAVRLRWSYANGQAPAAVVLTLSPDGDLSQPIVKTPLAGSVTEYAVALVPNQRYSWQLQPKDAQGHPNVAAGRGSFTTGAVLLVEDAPLDEQFKYVRKNAHNSYFKPTSPAVEEPLSPWYEVKRYSMTPPPEFATVKDDFPQPVWDGHPDALETYWYCWRIFLDKGNYPPSHPDSQAVANMNGIRDWAGWGSNQVFDSFCNSHFAKFGHQVYPFITQYDNAYARQHENGFICQECDNDNFEVYACHPAETPFLIAFAEWDYYLVSGDADRLRRVFLPLVKNYEWFMTYMRHSPGGIYGFDTPKRRTEACEIGPENFGFGATVYRTAETLAMARIAAIVGRPDMARFFRAEHRRLGDYINEHFWDAEHQLYNDRCGPNHLFKKYRDPRWAGKFVTEPEPGDINKPANTFFPLLGEIVPPERIRALKRLVLDPKKGFGWPNGIGCYSVDSAPQGSTSTVSYFGPTKHNIDVWAPIAYDVQHGFKLSGEWEVAREIAERYFKAVVAVYMKEKTIGESLDPIELVTRGHSDFIGWSGLAPIANFIEYVLGFDMNVPEKTVVWRPHQTERHGLLNVKVGNIYADFICDARASADAPCSLTIKSSGSFTLQTVVGGSTARHTIGKGTVTLRIG